MNYPHLNDIYISPKLKEQLLEISKYPMTIIFAPAGYGKTTAIKWWIGYRRRHIPDTVVYRLTAVDDNLVKLWEDLCRLLKKDRPEIAGEMLKMGYPKNGHTMLLLTNLWEESERKKGQEIYFVVDDVHNLQQDEFTSFLSFLVEWLPKNIHIVLLSRNPVFTKSQMMKAGRNVFLIPKDMFRLDKKKIQSYAECCKLPLSEENACRLTRFSGGWISIIYLTFCNYVHSGEWVFASPDIDRLIKEVMLDPLSGRERDFLTVCSVTSSFTKEQAIYLWNKPDAGILLDRLSSENAFISCDVDGIYRCHNLLRQNTEKLFTSLPEKERQAVWDRLGDWYLKESEYFPAMTAYHKARAWEKLMDTIVLDRNGSFGGIHKEIIHEWCENCPEGILRSHPKAILIFAFQYFINGDITTMQRLNRLILDVIKNTPGISERECNNFVGESEILTSFLEFNNISAMSEHHKKACGLMSRESTLVDCNTPWTFGSPSLLMLYHRQSGNLDLENQEMCECIPYYYQLTNCHGNGAEYSMRAETELMRGNFDDAKIAYWQAYCAAIRKSSDSILVTAEFIAMRIELINGEYNKAVDRLNKLHRTILESDAFTLIRTVDMCTAWIYSVLGKSDLIPEWITQDSAADTIKTVLVPIFLTVQNEVFLFTGEYTRLIAKSGEMKNICENNHMLLCNIYTHIQLSAALNQVNHSKQAMTELSVALDFAVPDRIFLPFVENGKYIREILIKLKEQGVYRDDIKEILRLENIFDKAKKKILTEHFENLQNYGLTKREEQIASLAVERHPTKEIAKILRLSEHTVKNHLSHIFEKMEISGNVRNKRERLREKLGK